MREIAWVIENECMSPPVHYFCGGRGGKSFSIDHMEAIRFTRRDDALQALTFFVRNPVQNCCEVREHIWLSTAQTLEAALRQAPAAPSQEAVLRVARLILSVSSISYDDANNERREMARAAAEKVIAALASPQGQESGVTKP